MLSSMADQDNIRRGLDAGANDYLIKPVLHAELIAKVRALIKAARS
jgi:DNA-binding response OmpR family regulator